MPAMRRLLALFAALTAMNFFSPPAHAYEVAPMRVFLVPEQGKTTSTITINNVREEELLVEILVKRRIIDEDGSQSFQIAEEDFVVFPPQMSIPAQSSQAVRIQFIGQPPTDLARSYVVEVAEVPVPKDGFSGVQFAYNFGVAVYVEPANSTVRLTILDKELTEDGLKLQVENSGNKYAVISQLALNIEHDGETLRLTPNDLAERINQPLMEPLSTREFVLALPEVPQASDLKVEFRRP